MKPIIFHTDLEQQFIHVYYHITSIAFSHRQLLIFILLIFCRYSSLNTHMLAEDAHLFLGTMIWNNHTETIQFAVVFGQ